MKAIVQKAKNIVFRETELALGLIVFIMNLENLEWCIEKALKLKIWNERKDNLISMNVKMIVVLPESRLMENIECKNSKYVIFLRNEHFAYVNDGPCTFLLD